MQTYPALDERSARALVVLLYEQPLTAVTVMGRMNDGGFHVCFKDARDGRDHVLLTVGDFIDWIDSVIEGQSLAPVRALCPGCNQPHSDHGLSGQLFELCLQCQVEIAEIGF